MEQWTHLFRIQGFISPKCKVLTTYGSLSLFTTSLPLDLWTPFHLFPSHYWISAPHNCWEGKCSSTHPQSPREYSIPFLVQGDDCVQRSWGCKTHNNHEFKCAGSCTQWSRDSVQQWIPSDPQCHMEGCWIIYPTNSKYRYESRISTCATAGEQ